ncbi:YdeI/OmpD-associated family protein [Solitalea canadensis]|uniref:Bacteriocin-protection, YdeI or OmpD-Associated n=1 Tax=Solitalea canadensis (strain ATCC 29591 / DSM 3403 / JCM 21819 / LMG 8368 / NBRC 15130 / NCIMB 12057 / USAM 9D) TaxID=929556 RepID=H8KR55_SOLCM|nr:YdeI/OmpD-associated family protein [Solitalea canadensis]AFD07261.1 protein of unknown function (DUF1905) [Solitalea canadensis DSM 3403]
MELLFDKEVLLEKIGGKGGWTIARIDIEKEVNKTFGQVKVKGNIDNYDFAEAHLMPMGNGKLFIPINAGIRKQLKKEVGDWVKITLYKFETSFVVPEMFIECLEDEPEALKQFKSFTDEEQQQYTDWIFSTDIEEAQIERIATAIDYIAKGYRLPKNLLKK